MNFLARSAPNRPGIEPRSLRRSLNTPVLAIAELPVGPGSAVIVAHVDSPKDRPRYTLAVRSERSREVVFFSVRDEDLDEAESDLAAEAALSLAEGMGFLFEDDLTPISREAAALIWAEFVGSATPDVPAPRTSPLLTKFRRPRSWTALGSSTSGPIETARPRVPHGAEAEFGMRDVQIARRGDR